MIKLPALALVVLSLGLGTGCSKKKKEKTGNAAGTTQQPGEQNASGPEESVLELKLKNAVMALQLKNVGEYKVLNADRTAAGDKGYTLMSLNDAIRAHTNNPGKIGEAYKTAVNTIIDKVKLGTTDLAELKKHITPAKQDGKLSDDEAENVGANYVDFSAGHYVRTVEAKPKNTDLIYTNASDNSRELYVRRLFGHDDASKDVGARMPDCATEEQAREAIYQSGLCAYNRRLLVLNYLSVLNDAMEAVSKTLDILKNVDKKVEDVDAEVADILGPITALASVDYIKKPKDDLSSNLTAPKKEIPLCGKEDIKELIDVMRSISANNIIKPILVGETSPIVPVVGRDSTGTPFCLTTYQRNSGVDPAAWKLEDIPALGVATSIFDTGLAYPNENSELLKAVQKLKGDLEPEIKKIVEQYNSAVAKKKPAAQAATPGS